MSSEKYNTFGKRFLAALIDTIVFLPFIFIDYWVEDSKSYLFATIFSIIYLFCWTAYAVVGHGKFGQTIGKNLMGIKVLDKNEQELIGYKRAFCREAVWFFAEIGAFVFYFINLYRTSSQENYRHLQNNIDLMVSAWLVVELITMLLNSKRRALHDYIAGSVVVDVNEMKREELQNQQQELLDSLR